MYVYDCVMGQVWLEATLQGPYVNGYDYNRCVTISYTDILGLSLSLSHKHLQFSCFFFSLSLDVYDDHSN